MLFTSPSFLFFHLAVVALRWVLPRPLVGPLLLLSSYAFYLSWGPRYGLLIGALTVGAWSAALGLERLRHWRRRALLAASIAVLLATLGYFKYSQFVSDQWVLLQNLVGKSAGLEKLGVVLPLAVSFYVFELISYLADVYRGERAERSLWRFALYVAYYPHLVAGPIVRAHELLPQLRTPAAFDGRMFTDGVFLCLTGLVKKTVFADRFGVWADAVFADPSAVSSFGAWTGALAYAAQIFCDFSGYTDLARGASQMLGLELPENFRTPYLATTITDFWRRWHITLSRWLRDYLYIPLGGNRGGTLRQFRNLILTMLLGGLWHGASWTFLFWGGLHGVLLATHKLWDTWASERPGLERARRTRAFTAGAWVLTQVCVVVGWVYFRAATFPEAHALLGRMFLPASGLAELGAGALPETLVIALWAGLALCLAHLVWRFDWDLRLHRWLPSWGQGLLWIAGVLVCYAWSESREQFIYFQF